MLSETWPHGDRDVVYQSVRIDEHSLSKRKLELETLTHNDGGVFEVLVYVMPEVVTARPRFMISLGRVRRS
jgi:hypothetical protein